MTTNNEHTKRYTILGAAFGCMFPVGSTLLQAALSPHGISGAGILEAQSMPLLWVIDTAPIFLGLFAGIAGRRQDEVAAAMHRVEEANRALGDTNTALEDANAELIRASQLKSQFLANMSHELRTPLNAIIGFSRILIKKTEGSLPERQTKNLKMVHESGQHLLELVNDILDIERIEAGMLTIKDSELDVVDMAHDVVAKLKPAAQDKELGLSCAAPNMELVMKSDPVRLRQLLDNLVNNAIKYSDSGNIRLEVGLRKPGHENDVCFCVHDEGIGIPDADLPTIFDAFKQVDGSTTRAQGGVGLGLHLVKKIAQLLGGDVDVTSEVGKGSTFTLWLPTSAIVSEETRKAPDIDLSPQGDGPLVLIIDDTPHTVEVMRSELVEAGFRVHATLTGKDGLKKARELQPDAILLDIIMPEMDGWAVLKELRRDPDLSSTAVIITSQLDDVPQAYDLGIVAWLTKPISPDEFKDIFDRLGVQAKDDVLVVEDDKATSSMMVQQLSEIDIHARCAFDGKEATEAFADRLPASVILDIMLPEMDGFQVLEHLRSLDGGMNIPVVVYTAKDLSAEERARLSGGMLEIVSKGETKGAADVVAKVRAAMIRTGASGEGAPVTEGDEASAEEGEAE